MPRHIFDRSDTVPSVESSDADDGDCRTDAEILRDRFIHDICLDCSRDESGHEVERDRWGDVVVRCVHRDYQPAV